MISLTGLEGFLPGPNITAENFIIQRRPRSHTLKLCVHLIIFQSVSLVKFITFHGNKYLSKYQIRLTLEDSNILSLNDFASFFFFPLERELASLSEPLLDLWLFIRWLCPTLCDPVDSSLHQAPLSMGFSRQEYWSRLPFPSPANLPDPGIECRSPSL